MSGVRIFSVLPRGVDVAQDISHSLPGYQARVIFDVGANTGQSAKQFLKQFPASRLCCFEPVFATFQVLKRNLASNPRVDCFQLAVGSSAGCGTMVLQDASVCNFLRGRSDEPIMDGAKTESVKVISLDTFCSENQIDHINYLKVDTEGGDLDVLHGAARMLSNQKIDFVQVEAGMNPANRRHVPFEAIKEYLEAQQYFLFGIYEQVNEWPTQEPHLRRTNPTFISQSTIMANSKLRK